MTSPPVASAGRSKKAEEDHDSEEVIAQAQEAAQIFSLLLKGIKNISIYRHAESRYTEYLEAAHKALTTFLDTEGVLPLKLSPFTLEFKKHVIYEDQNKENLTYKFYRDGMRFLMFRQGLPIEELLRFVLLAMETQSEAALFQEDMITRLWKEEFTCIEYVVVEGFGFGEMSEEEVAIEVEQIVGYLRKQLKANSKDITRFARLSAEDLELELKEIDQVRGGIISGRTATPDDRGWIQQELFAEEKARLFAKMVLILFQILELDSSADDFEMLASSFVQVLDTLLLGEDVRGAVALLLRFEKIAERQQSAKRKELVLKIRDNFRRKMVEPQRLDAVGRYILLSKKLDEEAVEQYLSVCGEEELIPLVDLLATMERPEGRKLLINVLCRLGANHAEVFARRLDHNSSAVVKDMLTILLRIDPPEKLRMFARCLEHPNLMIRLEGLKILAKAPEEGAAKYIELAMKDADLQMRLGAYRALAARSGARAAPALIKMMQAEDYLAKEQRERVAIATALGETKSREALAFFSHVFEQKASLFARGKQNDMKQLAIIGLAAMHSVDAFKVLAREVQNRANSKEIMEFAHKAALRLKTELQGGAKEGENG
ncbi:HEAT repeat domain-containing protein [Myxococcota bacterium]|nr:HEAT repeat domain-containing protein [Myxococcota bacterium]